MGRCCVALWLQPGAGAHALMRATRQTNTSGAQDAAAELVIALEHLAHHLNEFLPPLRAKLDLEP